MGIRSICRLIMGNVLHTVTLRLNSTSAQIIGHRHGAGGPFKRGLLRPVILYNWFSIMWFDICDSSLTRWCKAWLRQQRFPLNHWCSPRFSLNKTHCKHVYMWGQMSRSNNDIYSFVVSCMNVFILRTSLFLLYVFCMGCSAGAVAACWLLTGYSYFVVSYCI